MTAPPFHRIVSVAVGLLCLSMAACKSTSKSKSGFSDVIDYTTPDTKLSQEEYPFDENGNYLADVVSGKKRGSRNKPSAPPQLSLNTYDKPPETVIASTVNYEIPPASDPYTPVYSSGSSNSASSKPTTSAKPKPGSSSSSPKAKPKTSVAKTSSSKPKPKAKPKASSITYTIKKGDTLYGLANRYGTSVAAIKKASGLSSNTLRDGRTIKIPRK